MKYTQIPQDTFKELVMNAGILLSSFDPSTAEVAANSIIGATSGDVTFVATPTFTDLGEDINNCPKNTKELKRLESWETKVSGTFVSVNVANAKAMTAAADEVSGKITPRNDIAESDFQDIWLVADYSDKNGKKNGGYLAIHMLNSLSTGGFQLKTGDQSKGQFSFEFTGHYSINAQDTPPFEIYIKAGEAEPGMGG
jgi:hypothetical protein